MTYQLDPLGINPCPECGRPALFALTPRQDRAASGR
jgi:hypothetical protein